MLCFMSRRQTVSSNETWDDRKRFWWVMTKIFLRKVKNPSDNPVYAVFTIFAVIEHFLTGTN